MQIDSKIKDDLKIYLEKKIEGEKEVAEIVSVYPLKDDEVEKIRNAFPVLAKYRVRNVIRPSIVGGFIIRYGSSVINLSIANQLKSFKKYLYEIG